MTSDALDFDPMHSQDRENPHHVYRASRARPIAISPSIGAFMVTRYEDIVAVLADPILFSSSVAVLKLRDNPPEAVAELDAAGFIETPAVVEEVDGAAHAHQRRLYDLSFIACRPHTRPARPLPAPARCILPVIARRQCSEPRRSRAIGGLRQ